MARSWIFCCWGKVILSYTDTEFVAPLKLVVPLIIITNMKNLVYPKRRVGGGDVLPATDSPPIYPCATPLLLMISHHRLCLYTRTDPYNRSFWVQLTRPYRRLFKNLFQGIVNTKWFLPQEKNDAYHHLYRQIRSLIFDTHTSIHTCARIHTHARIHTRAHIHTETKKDTHTHPTYLPSHLHKHPPLSYVI